MIIWHTTLANIEDLEQLATAQLQTRSGDARLRYSLEFTNSTAQGPLATLKRTYRRPPSLGGGRVREEIRLTPEFSARLREVWPISARTGRRAPQTTRSLLRLLAARGPAAPEEADTGDRERRLDVLRAAFARRWPTGTPPSVINDLKMFLGERMPMHEAIESDEGLACVLSFVATHPATAEPWAPRVRELAVEFVDWFIARRLAVYWEKFAPDPATAELALDTLTEHARAAVRDGLPLARQEATGEIVVELGSTAEIMEMCLRLDGVFGWPMPTQKLMREDLARITDFLSRLRGVMAVEVLTRPASS